jgi:hypothetical protein
MARRAPVVFAILVLCVLPTAAAGASQTARISARFTPERLGAATTVSFGFHIVAGDATPPPLSAIELSYPVDLGFATSGLGLASCSPQALEVLGPSGCPADSQIGYGSAVAEIPFGSEPVQERVGLLLFAGPSPDGYLHLLLRVAGLTPVIAEVVLSGVLRMGRIDIVVPPIPALPEAPDVAVVQMQLTLGGDLTYYETVGGRRRAHRPPGVGLPRSCPPGGFPFAATFAFIGAPSSTAHTAVACPRARRGAPVKA